MRVYIGVNGIVIVDLNLIQNLTGGGAFRLPMLAEGEILLAFTEG